MNEYLAETNLLNYKHPTVVELTNKRGWNQLLDEEKIKQIYNFVKNEILFGYNESDELPASIILLEGYGQCNTKSTLFMALLRSVEIPCRFHGFIIDKKLQKGVIDGILYKITPDELIHSWVEVFWNNKWISMEGLIIDNAYLKNIQITYKDCKRSFCGYGISTENLMNPRNEWNGEDTYIQKESIVRDLGVFNSPDEFYEKYGSNLKGLKKILYKYIIRQIMNTKVKKIRDKIK